MFSASPDISIDPPTTNTTNTIQQLFQFNQNDVNGDARCIEISLLEDLLLEGNETFTIELSLVSSSIVVIIGPCLRYVIILDINSESLSSMTLNRFSLRHISLSLSLLICMLDNQVVLLKYIDATSGMLTSLNRT